MKIMIKLTLCIFVFACTNSRQLSKTSAPQKDLEVHVKDWGKMKMMIGDDIWTNAEDEIISQIGKVEYAAVKSNYDYKSIPPAMSLFNAENRKDIVRFYEKLSTLKMHKIAGFSVNSGGQMLGRNAILKVPYKGNEAWDVNVQWDSTYFVVSEDALEIKKE